MSANERTENLATALRDVLKLIDDGVLVRNTYGDADMMTFVRQGMRITNALKAAQDALAAAERAVSPSAGCDRHG